MLKIFVVAAFCAVVSAKPGFLHHSGLPEVVAARTVLPAYPTYRTLGANVLGVEHVGVSPFRYESPVASRFAYPSYGRSVYSYPYAQSYVRNSLLPSSYAYRTYGDLGHYYNSPVHRSYPSVVRVAPKVVVPEVLPTYHHSVVPSYRTVVPSVHSVVPSVHSVVPSVQSVVPSVHSVVPSVHSVVPSVSAADVDVEYRPTTLNLHGLKSYGWNYDSMKDYGW